MPVSPLNGRKTQNASNNAAGCVGRRRNDAENTVHSRRKADAKQQSVTMNERNRKLWLLSFGLILSTVAIRTKLYLSQRDRRGRGRRRWWVRPVNRSRKEDGHYDNLFRQLKETDHEEFFRLTRMRPDTFDQLLHLVSPFLVKKSIRKPLSTELRLALTVTYVRLRSV